MGIIRWSITPSAKRNSYRVATPFDTCTQGSGLARNPGLGNSNTYRVAAAYVVFVMRDMLFVCMDVGCILMSGSTDFNDISGPLRMVRTLGNSVGVAIS